MPTFQITDPNTGKKVRITGDSPPTQEEAGEIFSQIGGESSQKSLPTRATPEQFLSSTERLATGFSPDPIEEVNRLTREAGLAEGTPLEPTPQTSDLITNIKDLPNDILDIVGPSIPAILQISGNILGATGGPAGIVGGGIVGAGAGEATRQQIGKDVFGFNQGTVGERAGRIAMEAGLAGIGEVGAIAVNASLKSIKKQLVNGTVKLLRSRGPEKAAEFVGRVLRNTNAATLDDAVKLTRRGDNSIYQKEFANQRFLNDFSEKLIYGDSDDVGKIASHIKELSNIRQGSKSAISQLLKKVSPMSEDAIDTVISQGGKINQFSNNKTVLNMSKRIMRRFETLFDPEKGIGKQLSKARQNLAKQAGGKQVDDLTAQSLTKANMELAKELSDVGLLVHQGDGVFTINPTYAATNTGRAQKSLFSQLVTEFFDVPQGLSSMQTETIKKAIIDGNEELIKKMTRGKTFSVNSTKTFKDFIKKLKTLDVQISGNEFKTLDKLSPALTKYLRSLRGVTDDVAGMVGNTEIRYLNQSFKDLSDAAAPFKQAIKSRDFVEIEKQLIKMASPSLSAGETQQANVLNRWIKQNLNEDVVKSIKSYNAYKEIDNLKSIPSRSSVKNNLMRIMSNPHKKDIDADLIDITNIVDPYLPDGLKVGLNSIRHSVAKSLQEDALSIFKASFVSRSLFVPLITPLATGATAGVVGGPEAIPAGLAVGVALQRPNVIQALVKQAAKRRSVPSVIRGTSTNLPAGSGVAGTQLLRALIQNQ